MICDKISYKTNREARNAINGMGREDGKHLKQYRCKECGNIHLATVGKNHTRPIHKINIDSKTSKIKMPKFNMPVTIEKLGKDEYGQPYATEKVFASLFNWKNIKT